MTETLQETAAATEPQDNGRPPARLDTVLMRAPGPDGTPRVALFDVRTEPRHEDDEDAAVRAGLDHLPRDVFGHCLFIADVPLPPRPGGLPTWPCRLLEIPTPDRLRRGLAALGRECREPAFGDLVSLFENDCLRADEWHRWSLGDTQTMLSLRHFARWEQHFAPLIYGRHAFQLVKPLSPAGILAAAPGHTAFRATYPQPGQEIWTGTSTDTTVHPKEYARFLAQATAIQALMPAARIRLRMQCGFVKDVVVLSRLVIRVTIDGDGEHFKVDLALN